MTGWTTVHDRLLALAPTFTGLNADAVYDGIPLTREYQPSYVIIGDDLNGNAGEYTQDFSDVGYMTDEQGTVNCVFAACSGTTDMSALRAVVQGWIDSLRAEITADKRLGVLAEGSYVNVARIQVQQERTKDGAAAYLVVQVAYFTRL